MNESSANGELSIGNRKDGDTKSASRGVNFSISNNNHTSKAQPLENSFSFEIEEEPKSQSNLAREVLVS